MVRLPAAAFLRGAGVHHECSYTDNIAEAAYDRGCIEPIDVVYTWVNGSDPIWAKQKEKYLQRYLCEVMEVGCQDNSTASTPPAAFAASTLNATNATAASTGARMALTSNFTAIEQVNVSDPNLTLHPSPSPSSSEPEGPSVGTDNRYQDNEELRYSLRSLFRFAPGEASS